MNRRLLRRLMVAVVVSLWVLPGSGCLPWDQFNATVDGLLDGAPNVPEYVFDLSHR